MIHKDAREKVVRYDGVTIPGDLHHIVPTLSDPRKRKNIYWNREKEEAMELPVPLLLIDNNYVGEPPKVEVTIDNLNDNVDRQFLLKTVNKFGKTDELQIEYHPLTKKHLGKNLLACSIHIYKN
jgi:histone-lysine N-methyltransferase SETD1